MPRIAKWILLLGCCLWPVEAQVVPAPGATPQAKREESAEEILRSVREQQAMGLEQRKRWVFDQQVLVRLLRRNGKLAREEQRSYRVRPGTKGQERDLLALKGKVTIKGTVHRYSDPEYRTGSIDLDGELAESFANELLFDRDSPDGVGDSMYPLSERMMRRHKFTFYGEEAYQGRSVYRFTFAPNPKDKGKASGDDDDQRGFWEGEVLVDCDVLAPVLVVTHQARKVPFVVRTLLGSNVQQVGFKLEYNQMPDGTWFPSRYSGEFSLRVLFGYSRRISLSMRNENFERTSAESEIEYHLETSPFEHRPGGDELSADPAEFPDLSAATPGP